MESTDTAAALLAGLRVLECGDTVAPAYAGRLRSDLGADVVRVEGQHTREVLTGLLGLPDDEVDELVRTGVAV
jgi:crotonobetainyl-CoA:carnitine CoA-transferase CaiB-like acyl-CoA transferase